MNFFNNNKKKLAKRTNNRVIIIMSLGLRLGFFFLRKIEIEIEMVEHNDDDNHKWTV